VTREKQTFFWNKNNNFETAYNWDDSTGANCAAGGAGCPTLSSNGKKFEFKGKVTIPDADACTAEKNIWSDKVGRVMKIATDIDLSTLVLPTNGKIILGDDITMTIKEEAKGDVATAWACKKPAATSFKCGDNWSLKGFDEPAAHEVPCHEDTIVFPDDSRAVQVHIPTATFAKEVKIEHPEGKSPQFVLSAQYTNGEITTQADVNSYISLTAGQFEGGSININTLGCEPYCAATCTNDCGLEFAAKTNATKTFNVNGKDVVMTDDEWQRQVMHAAAQAQLDQAKKWNDEMTKLTDSKDYDKFLTRGTLARAPVVKDWITAELDELNDALPKAAYANGTVFADAAAKVESLNTAIKLMLGDLLGASSAVTKQIACKANAKTGAISCDGIKKATVRQGQATSTLYTIINAINAFFGEIDFDNFKVPDAGVLDKLTKDADVELDFEFSYADADFRASPYHRSMGGFLGNSQCDAIESSLSYEIAMETYTQFAGDAKAGIAPSKDADKFLAYIKDMVEVASIYKIDELAFCDQKNKACTIRSPVVADTNERRARRAAAVHSYSPANFNMRVKLTVKGGVAMFSKEALASAMGIGMWGSNALYLQLAKVESVAAAFSSTTTTTVRTTEAAGAVVLKDADAFKATDVDASLDTAAKLQAMKAKLEGQVESADAAVKSKGDKAADAKAAKDSACAGQLYKTSACDSAKKLVEAALNDYDQAVYDAAAVKAKLDVYAPLAAKAQADADAKALAEKNDADAALKNALDGAKNAAKQATAALENAEAAVAAALANKAELDKKSRKRGGCCQRRPG